MAKVFYSDTVHGEILLKGFISQGKLLIFNYSGKFIREEMLSGSVWMPMKEVDALSILHANGHIEIGLNFGRTFLVVPTSKTLLQLMNFFNQLDYIVFSGLKPSADDDAQYKQYIYTFQYEKHKVEDIIRGIS